MFLRRGNKVRLYKLTPQYDPELRNSVGDDTARYPSRTHSALLLAASIALILCIFLTALIPPQPRPQDEGNDYFAIAAGNYSDVHYYYAKRVLHPLTAGFIARATGSSLPTAFHLLSILSLAVYLGAILIYITSATNVVFALTVTPLLLTPQLIAAFQDIYFPTLFFWALLAVFFLTLQFNFWSSLLPLALLCFTRESAVVLVAAIVATAIAASRRNAGIAAGAVGLASLELASMLISPATSNVHHMSALMYYPLKALYDFSNNVLGLTFWTNTDAPFTSCAPRNVVRVPAWIHFLGAVRQIGFCGFDLRIPFKTILMTASTFAVMPVLLGIGVARSRTRWRSWPFDVVVALIYGGLAIAMAPLVGVDPARYLTEAFPAFWMVGLVVLHSLIGDRIGRAAQFAVITVAAVWLPALLGGGNLEYDPLGAASLTRIIAALAIVLALDALAYRLVILEPGPSFARASLKDNHSKTSKPRSQWLSLTNRRK